MHCQLYGRDLRERQGYPEDLWITHFDADEYFAMGPITRVRPQQREVDVDIKMWLEGLPASVDGLIMPRLAVINGGELTGQPLDSAPTDILGSRYFEPRAYTTLKMTKSMCFGKWIARMRVFDVANTTNDHVHVLPQDIFQDAPCTNMLQTDLCSKYTLSGPKPPFPTWLREYSSPQLYHFVSRSKEECARKAANHAQGRSATRPTMRATNPGHRGLPSSTLCDIDGWERKPRSYNLWQYADAVEGRARHLRVVSEEVDEPQAQAEEPQLISPWDLSDFSSPL